MPDDIDDRELVRRVLAGDAESIDFFDRKFRPRFELIARSFGVPYPDYQDVAQEALVDALRQLSRFEWKCALRTWLEKIVRGKIFDRLRRLPPASVHIEAELPLDFQLDRQVPHLSFPAVKPNYEDVLTVRGVLEAMPPRDRVLLRMNQQLQLTGHEIDVRLGWPKGTAGPKITRAKELFRKMILQGTKSPPNRRLKKGGQE